MLSKVEVSKHYRIVFLAIAVAVLLAASAVMLSPIEARPGERIGPISPIGPITQAPGMLSSVEARAASDTVYITNTGTKFHRGNCSCLKKSKIAISRSDAIAQGYKPCKRWKP